MSKVNEAVDCFNNGFNCAQAVFSTYCAQFGISKELALKLSYGFGAGMGRSSGTCGALSGACLLIGLKHGDADPDDKAAKETTYNLVRELIYRFTLRNEFTSCSALLGADLLANDSSAMEKVGAICPKLVRDVAEIVEELLELD